MGQAETLSPEFKYRLLLGISQRISQTFDLQAVLAQLLDSLRSVIRYDAAGIFVLNRSVPLAADASFVIAGMATVGFPAEQRSDDPMLRFGRGIIGHVITSGQPVVSPDVRVDPHYVEGRPTTRSEIAVPIVSNDRVIGALNLESDELAAYAADDVHLLEFFATAAALSIEKAVLHREVLERQHVTSQLRLAREVQANLLPAGPPAIPGFEVAAANLPSFEIGGDYYDYIPLRDGRVVLVVADVAGKGIPAALIMASFRAALRTGLRKEADAARLLSDLDEHIVESAGVSRFVTMIYAVLDPASGLVSYVNCGHNPPLLIHPDGASELLDKGGPALGMPGRWRFEPATVALRPGGLLALYTDGVVELTNPADQEFGVDRLRALLRSSVERQAAAGDIIRAVVETTRQFGRHETYEDDFTLVVVRRSGAGAACGANDGIGKA